MNYHEIKITYMTNTGEGLKFCPICGYPLVLANDGKDLIRHCTNPKYAIPHLYHKVGGN